MDALKVKDVMTHLVVTLRPEDAIPYAAKRLVLNRISGAPVVSGGRLVGVVSGADLVRAYTRELKPGTVADVMTDEVVTIGPEDNIWKAASLIDRHCVRRLPVIDGDRYVVGVLARSDLVRCMAQADEAAG